MLLVTIEVWIYFIDIYLPFFYKEKGMITTPSQAEFAQLLRQWILDVFPDYEKHVPPLLQP